MSKSSDAASAVMSKKRERKGVQRPGPVAAPEPIPAEINRPEGTYLDFPVLAQLPELLADYRSIQLQLAATAVLEKRRKELGQSIEALMLAAGAKSVTAGAIRCTHVETSGRKTLSADKLLQLGVSADVIVEATVVGKPSSSIRVTAIDEELDAAKQGNGCSFTLGSKVA